MQLKGAEKNYPVHEKELLAIIRALRKWRSDLLGTHFVVYTNHCTLKNFDTQKDLSCRQLRWQEFLSQYDMTITYVRGEDNTVADAHSCLPPNSFPNENAPVLPEHSVNAIFQIASDSSILSKIKSGYTDDKFCKWVAATTMKGWQQIDGLWYIGDHLLIPWVMDICKNLFHLVHDSLGHFSADKSYASLRNNYYWPNMCCDLEDAYIPSCMDCLRNKSRTTKPTRPLHPLPVPDRRASSITMDFIGPLPMDNKYDSILSVTDCLGANIQIIPTRINIIVEDLALPFFNNWYCENRLPDDIVCDRDKLFISKFWKALTKLTGVKLKMSMSFHPETDGSSERSNKTINQMLCYHVKRNQKGWVRVLPWIHFQIMNMINASTGYSGFQLHLGHSPHVIPPIVSNTPPLAETPQPASSFIKKLLDNVADARDNLLLAKFSQTHHANQSQNPNPIFPIGDMVMLSTTNRRHAYKKKGEKRVAKFFPQWDGPYKITNSFPEASTYTLQTGTAIHPVFHISQMKCYIPNDLISFPSHILTQPLPVFTTDGLKEYIVEEIVNSRRVG